MIMYENVQHPELAGAEGQHVGAAWNKGMLSLLLLL